MNLVPASESSLLALSTLFARSFEGYFVNVPDVPHLFDARVRSEHISLVESRVALVDGAPAGLVLMARRGRVSRVAGMGIVPAWRGRGLGAEMLKPLMEEARSRGDCRMVLEVIEQNAPAVKLYERLGFRRVRRLVGFTGTPTPEPGVLREVPLSTCAALLPEGLPWQLAPATVLGSALPTRAFRLGDAVAVVADVSAPALVLRSIAVAPSQRGRGEGRRLLRALAAAHPGKALVVSAVVPEGLCDRFFLGAGFAYPALSQLEMAVDFAPDPMG
ncbi:GNAT family N-acetyltransferase [Myxococcus sp. K15C18031901]|uniref:GNAT family N-acetyltransferase n=1 Tax=Myxococcus dinghuensis TaxID=2906761 RepID=UPI0020A7746E|nr:GNAT family N-acetyltransferase [Myxococcus dinghuensis]MCP3103216.1 GNAT family N-acetyltransferase [Myxococcus dinghuensis]